MTNNTYLFDKFVNTTAGQPFRLFPFGKVVKNGNIRSITPEYARLFKLPHFKPAIKLGSHEDATPAGGHIVGLEVREDGLYAIPEWNDNGNKALTDGAYRYQSPEVIWDDGGLEDPISGDYIMGPLIMGDALLHTPHLGEAAALYSVETIDKEKIMENEKTLNIFEQFIEKLTALVERKPETVQVEVAPEDYEVTKQERDQYAAKLQEIEKAETRRVKVEKFAADLKETKADTALAELLADVPQDTAEAIMKQFRALSEQVKENELTGEAGSEGGAVEDPKAAFNALVLKYSAEKSITYNKAFEIVKIEQPDLFAAWAVREK